MIRPRISGMRTLRLLAVLCLAALLAAPAAQAQTGPGKKPAKDVELVPPTPPIGKADIPWYPYGAGILLLIIVVAVNFIPSKRGHQD